MSNKVTAVLYSVLKMLLMLLKILISPPMLILYKYLLLAWIAYNILKTIYNFFKNIIKGLFGWTGLFEKYEEDIVNDDDEEIEKEKLKKE